MNGYVEIEKELMPHILARTVPAGGAMKDVNFDYLVDIDELEHRLLDQSSYLTRLGFDYQRALKDLRRSVNAETQLARFFSDVQKLVMQIGDCHASVQSGVELPTSGFLPGTKAA